MRRLVMCFDGTWNDVNDRTNVARIHEAIPELPEQAGGPAAQIKYYDPGVGTHLGSILTGGMLGNGLTENVREGYAWLIRHWRPDDQLFLFGFSRGAYTARSLAGMIGKCGILREEDPAQPDDVRQATAMAAAREASGLYKLSNIARFKDKAIDPLARLGGRTRPARIHFLGVWDTVGALGVPLLNLSWAEDFHDTRLGQQVDHAYHALAIDEYRADYQATMWSHVPDPARQVVEQRWFPGAHANVGGGYPDDPLARPPLAWIAGKARDCGLAIADAVLALDGDEYRAPVCDSFAEFGFGLYRLVKLNRRHLRPIGAAVAEQVDDSAMRKWNESDYHPANLAGALAIPP